MLDLQKAGLWKRTAAWMFDGILLSVLVVGVGFLLSLILNYDSYNDTVNDSYEKYETQYSTNFEVTQEEFAAMSDEERKTYEEAYNALISDEEAMYAYNMVINLTMVILTIAILAGYLVLEFIVPLCFGNGQTLGKKIFSICLMRTDGVRINTMQLFVRTILGKYTIETMVPVYIIILIVFGTIGSTGTLILGGMLLAQIILLAVTRTNSVIHDLLAGTAVVDISSQMIFHTTEELIAYKKRIHAEKAARQKY